MGIRINKAFTILLFPLIGGFAAHFESQWLYVYLMLVRLALGLE